MVINECIKWKLSQPNTIQELETLFSACDDTAGHHMLCVDFNGNVRIDIIPKDLTPLGHYEKNKKTIKFRLETFSRGNGYVGPDSIQNDDFLLKVYF